MLLFLILLFFGSRLTPYLCLLKWCFCFNLFFTLMGSTKKEDYNLDKVFQVEKWIFLVDAACSLGVGMNRFPDVAENILLVVFGVTLAAHVYVFKSKKFRKENE